MTTRNTPLYVVDGTVKIYAPRTLEGKGKYFRIVYPFKGGYKDTTALTVERAKALAGKFARGLKQGGDFRFQLSGNEFLDAYLDPETREVNGRSWGGKHSLAQESLLNKYVRPVIGALLIKNLSKMMIYGVF